MVILIALRTDDNRSDRHKLGKVAKGQSINNVSTYENVFEMNEQKTIVSDKGQTKTRHCKVFISSNHKSGLLCCFFS